MAEELKLTKLAQCAGCGAKVGAGVLAQLLQGMPVQRDDNLLVGYDTSDDASVYKISDELVLVQTLDFFPPIVDDPFLFGQIAAANALSDIYAMGATPKLAMNIMTITQEMSPDTVHEILRGGYDKAFEAGVIITGGHTIQDKEPKYGLSVTGFARPEEILLNCAARPGDVLLLTKPLGIGITTTAHKGGFAPEELYKMAVTQMAQLNKTAFLLARPYALHSCTDVTGFGLMGHATEMARGGAVTVVLESSKVPVLPGVYELAQMGLLPEGMYRNRHFAEP
ncbi:MAG: selenide, water dikinase SelD, partial [Ruthenibacterium sp.]